VIPGANQAPRRLREWNSPLLRRDPCRQERRAAAACLRVGSVSKIAHQVTRTAASGSASETPIPIPAHTVIPSHRASRTMQDENGGAAICHFEGGAALNPTFRQCLGAD
jgi:hypothetical protein